MTTPPNFNHIVLSEQAALGSLTSPIIADGAVLANKIGVTASLVLQDLTYTAANGGTAGNSITIAYTAGGTAGAEVVTVTGSAISVKIASGVSTATQVRNAINLYYFATLLVTVSISGTASNPQVIVSPTSLSGGSQGSFPVTVPGGSNGELQYNNSGVFGGTAHITTDGTNLTLSTGSISAASATLGNPLPVASGGTGTTSPSLIAGTNISITGSWPNQTINSTVSPVTPGGVTGNIQFNNGGSFSGANSVNTDGTNLSLDNASSIRFNGLADSHWVMGRNVASFTQSLLTSNVLSIVIAGDNGTPGTEGFSIGTVFDNLSILELDGATHNAYFRGSVGVGQPNPQAKLHVTGGGLQVGDPGNDQSITFGGTNAGLYWSTSGASIVYSVGSLLISSSGVSNELTIGNSGPVSVNGVGLNVGSNGGVTAGAGQEIVIAPINGSGTNSAIIFQSADISTAYIQNNAGTSFSIGSNAPGGSVLNIDLFTGNLTVSNNVIVSNTLLSDVISSRSTNLILLPITDSTTGIQFTKANQSIVAAIDTTNSQLDMHSHFIVNVLDPVNPQDAATKNYVDTHPTPPAGSNTQIQYNASGVFGADANLTWDYTTTNLTLSSIGGGVGAQIAIDNFTLGANNPYAGGFVQLNATGLGAFGMICTGGFIASDCPFIAGKTDTVATNPDPSIVLGAISTTQGFLPPVMTAIQKNAIVSPAEGLIVYDTDNHSPYFWNGSSWVAF